MGARDPVSYPGYVDVVIDTIDYVHAKELLPILVAAALWGECWRGCIVLCHCDNMSVVAAIKGSYCKDSAMVHLLRCLFYLEAKFCFKLTAEHVAGVENGVADAISRFCLSPQINKCPAWFQ